MMSQRFPGKVLLPLRGRPVLSWVIRAALESQVFQRVIVATSVDRSDDEVAKLAELSGATPIRGHMNDVLERYVQALDAFPALAFVRLTGDCPLIDPELIRLMVTAFDASDLDYLSTTLPRTLPRGMDVEVVSASALESAHLEASGAHRAHVTSFIYARPTRFRLGGFTFRPNTSRFRVTVDVPEDLRAISAIVESTGDRPPGWREVVAILRMRPDIVAINADVRQKPLRDG